MIVKILTVCIIFIWLFLSIIIYYMTLPKKALSITENLSSSVHDYIESIYTNDIMGSDFYTNFNWLWDTAPEELQKTAPIAQNLSVEWPPAKGSRFRMTAFPYPDTGKSKFWLFQFFKGISSLLDNTSDQVTFPGWQISIYDPLNPHDNTWANFLTVQLKWDRANGAISQSKPVYMEVIHSCYVPPSMEYPYCDDGGYWLYGTSGSGIFWSSGSYHPHWKGGCLVANNKMDAMFKLLETDDGKKALTLGTNDPNMTAIKYMINALKDGGGGTSITKAMKSVIDAFHNHDQIPKLVAFRTMEPSSAKFGWGQAITLTLFFTIGLMTMLGICIYRIIKKRPWGVTFVWVVALIVTFIIVLVIQWSVIIEYMLRGFGYMTLDMALEKTGMNLEEFIYSSAGRDSDGNPLPYNSVANSLSQTQMFDFDLDTFCNANRLNAIIMHTQPNKSGSWAVEIMDVRNTPFKKDAKKLKDLIYPLGLCGQPVKPEDKNWQLMPPLRQGPIQKSPLYLGYQPDLNTNDSLCNCDEDAVAKQYNNGKGDLKKCVFCQRSISQQLC